ncbi:nucleoside hydrolase [Rhodopirellula sp. JC740]|uniref:Nucleoside hydrolase n=1 Tax=Rhodopirellula halodulae TaxID=2894198 RepID=A0ABS8NF32_9BACT|nr:nucleoside hydrolase [Rhodopirellula sp. JC740]MCC9642169.1 nucleoside hydrolase [Rhodopirellula sp. JC740]
MIQRSSRRFMPRNAQRISIPIGFVFVLALRFCVTESAAQTPTHSPKSTSTPVQVIFDTDITGDCDDVLALAMLHALQDRDECELKAVTISKVNPLAAPFVDAINTFYGRGEIPVGTTREAQRRSSKYLELCKIKDGDTFRYPHDLLRSEDAPTAVEVLRRTLADAADNSIVIVQVGLATNLADLLDSKGDSISPLSGMQLLQQKCKLISVMAGCFGPALGKPQHLEANVVNGLDAMQRFASKSPSDVPVVWSDFRIGIAAPFPRESIAREFSYVTHHPVREAYLMHSGPNHDRPSWDLTSVLHAVRPDDNYFVLSPRGRVTVDDEGLTEFVPDENGRDQLLKMSPKQTIRVVEVQRALASQPPRCLTE